jgi:hypothetical protein
METRFAHELYATDRDAYLAAFWALESNYQWSEAELDLVNALAFFLGSEDVEGLPDVVAMGYLSGLLEAWRSELAECRITTIWRDYLESDIARKFNKDWDIPAWSRIIYSVMEFRSELEHYAYDSPRLFDRLRVIADSVGERVFTSVEVDKKSFKEWQKSWREFHCCGVALCLYTAWLNLMDDLGVPEHERWTENFRARPISDALVSLDFPIDAGSCELDREDLIGGYEIRSRNRRGTQHKTRFRAIGDTAEIVGIVVESRRSTKIIDVPEASHVDVLRKLGFSEMVFPNRKRYEIRTWPGIRRIKD